MSLIKQYGMDAEAVEAAAVRVSVIADDAERFRALSALYRECGELALCYADPHRVARMFVQDASETYIAERWNLRQRPAALAA